MGGGSKWFGWWGNLPGPKQQGIVTYVLSPYEQRAFAYALQNAFFKTFRRCAAQAPYIVPTFAIGYGVYSWGMQHHEYLASKAGQAAHGEH
ncbi:uncharacterized protein VTP21DRAFT_8197 [Calcarisporiella thermophila]|uniref:uncharacterized protein n=1 Tax=Calcarisporiella thermophila TaxID=911321 RepID=UPI0037434C52